MKKEQVQETSDSKPLASVINVDIVEEMKRKYIDYSMSVIVSRALPDVRDGLKPVQRRILYSMFRLGILPTGSYKKCARTVGDVIAKYHPHGDVGVYDALVRMAQEFSLRYPLIDGQGNFGSVDGDYPAAMRYTEARLAKLSMKMLEDLDKGTVDFVDNYDKSKKEPVVLPSLVPNLLINGADGIAVGMATKIPPHNLNEVVDGLLFMAEEWKKRYKKTDMVSEIRQFINDLKRYDPVQSAYSYENISRQAREIIERHKPFELDVSVSALMRYIKGPDFPTGGTIYGAAEIERMYAIGNGCVVSRAVTNIEEGKSGRYRIVVSEIPYQVNKAKLVEHIADLVKSEKIVGVSDIRDESNREGIRIVIELKKGIAPKVVLNRLYKYTEMQIAYHGNFVALVDREPTLLTLKDLLQYFMQFRQEVVIRRTLFELIDAKHRAHILEGLLVALDYLDEVIKVIRSSKTTEEAKKRLINGFKLTDVQAQAILDMPLKRLVALERQKIEEDYKSLSKLIDELVGRLASPEKVIDVISNELLRLKELFGDERRTKIVAAAPGAISEEAIIPDEEVVVTLSYSGYVKRVPASAFKTQKRGGKGVVGAAIKEHDTISHIVVCNNHDRILFFTNLGKVYTLKAFDIPEFSRQAKGQPVVNIINIAEDERVTAILMIDRSKIKDEDMLQEDQTEVSKYLMMGTERGYIKRVPVEMFKNIRQNGLIAIRLDPGDHLRWVLVTDGKKDVFVASSAGRCIRFSEKEVPIVGRNARGVRAMRLPDNVEMIGMDVVRKDEDRALTVSEKGFGKITLMEKYQRKHRGGKGMLTFRCTAKTGQLAVFRVLDKPDKDLLIMTKKGHVIKTSADTIRVTGRVASGVRLIKMDEDDRVTSMACW